MKTNCFSNPDRRFSLILTAAGSSTRMSAGSRMGPIKKKEYLKLGNGTVLSTAARVFLQSLPLTHLIITVPENGEPQAREALFSDSQMEFLLNENGTQLHFIQGGNTRQKSVFHAIEKLHDLESNSTDFNSIVLIHDAARPFVTEKVIKDCALAAVEKGASVPCIPCVDTQKQISPDGTIEKHLKRSTLGAVQTPQAFELEPLYLCHKEASLLDTEFTDDSEIWDAYPAITGGRKVAVVDGDVANKKITYAQDLKKMIHVGIGNDLHKLVEGRDFVLGGIVIPSDKGEEAHSDGDVLLHAITDALLGASGLGDIGSYFPPEDMQWKDASSIMLIQKCWNDVKAEGWNLVNLDCVVELEKPKFLPWRQQVVASIAEILGVETNQVFVKAKTNEKLDSVGQGLAVKATCVALLEK